MDDITLYKNKKVEESINFLVDLIMEKINDGLDYCIVYNLNFMITGYNNVLDVILNKLENSARSNNIDIIVNTKFIPNSSTNLIIKASKSNNMFLKYTLKEAEFYNKVINNNKIYFDMQEDKLNNLYVLDALKTSFYRAGFDKLSITINNNVYELNAINKTKKYYPKVVLMDMIKYSNKIEEDRENNINKKILMR